MIGSSQLHDSLGSERSSFTDGVCFVTVGTTRFDQLINSVLTDFNLNALYAIGIRRVVLQIGAGEFLPLIIETIFGEVVQDSGSATTGNGILIEYYRYKKSIAEDIASASLVIGHAGAGTCLDCLQAGKPLIVVVNDRLMDNHQLELALKLAELNFLLYCNPSGLEETLNDLKLFALEPYRLPPFNNVAKYLDSKLGLTA